MSANRWFMLWMVFLSYLLLGAFIFYAIERRYEETRRVEDTPEKLDIEGIVLEFKLKCNSFFRKLKIIVFKIKIVSNVAQY